MPIDQIVILEKRVHQLMNMVKCLKEDKTVLEKKVRTMGQQLTKQDRDSLRWNQDRVRLRSKVERILSDVGILSARSNLTGSETQKPRKRRDA